MNTRIYPTDKEYDTCIKLNNYCSKCYEFNINSVMFVISLDGEIKNECEHCGHKALFISKEGTILKRKTIRNSKIRQLLK